MTWDEYDQLQEELLKICGEVSSSKGREYANSLDRLANFKRLGARLKVRCESCGKTTPVPPAIVAWIFFTKHRDAIESHISTGADGSEPIQGRFVDAINYLILTFALLMEGKGAK